jgi:hypothetical protein
MNCTKQNSNIYIYLYLEHSIMKWGNSSMLWVLYIYNNDVFLEQLIKKCNKKKLLTSYLWGILVHIDGLSNDMSIAYVYANYMLIVLNN